MPTTNYPNTNDSSLPTQPTLHEPRQQRTKLQLHRHVKKSPTIHNRYSPNPTSPFQTLNNSSLLQPLAVTAIILLNATLETNPPVVKSEYLLLHCRKNSNAAPLAQLLTMPSLQRSFAA